MLRSLVRCAASKMIEKGAAIAITAISALGVPYRRQRSLLAALFLLVIVFQERALRRSGAWVAGSSSGNPAVNP